MYHLVTVGLPGASLALLGLDAGFESPREPQPSADQGFPVATRQREHLERMRRPKR